MRAAGMDRDLEVGDLAQPSRVLVDHALREIAVRAAGIDAVGVVADDTWTAIQVAKSLGNSVTWTLPVDLAAMDSAALDANANVLVKSKNATSFMAELVETWYLTALTIYLLQLQVITGCL